MLTNPNKITSAGTVKQIAISTNSAGVVYTVPTGKTFTGYFASGAINSSIQINGVTVYCTGGAASLAGGVIPLTLVANTVITGGSTNAALVGTEQ